ncbi:MAG: AAA family ATPase [Gaiellaceae bacterium]
MTTNPFRYGALALGDAFTNREAEVAELLTDIVNGQDVVVFAPRRYGKSSLVWRVSQQAVARDVLVAHVNLMTTPTTERLAEKLAETIHDDLASTLYRARERLRVFADLRITPVVTVDPNTGKLGFAFDAGRQPQDLEATVERLFELPGQLAAERERKVALVLDEFQEIVDIDPELPKLMRSVFETQPDVAHVYLGSRRHMLERIFNDENEPFWRSAKQMELGVIAPALFRGYIGAQFERTGREIAAAVVDRVLGATLGHPYATQELCYFLWGETPEGDTAGDAQYDTALEKLLRAEHAHFGLVWEKAARAQRVVLHALAREPGRPLSGEYRRRHGLPAPSSVQRALDALAKEELIARDPRGEYRIAEPFLAEWLRREEQ